MSIRIASVQTLLEKTDEGNLAKASKYLDQAVAQGADIVCFPETFPGPWRRPSKFSCHAEMAALAKSRSVYMIYGTSEKLDEADTKHTISLFLLGPDGKLIGRYDRCCPPGPWLYKQGALWDVNYVGQNQLPVFETELGKIGLLVCSEVYMPELSRALAIKGAEITFLPAGIKKGPGNQWYNTWRTLMQARASENLMYTITCNNLQTPNEIGLNVICSPENELGYLATEGVLCVTADLDRVRLLRDSSDNYFADDPFLTKPGTLREWRRPEVYSDVLAQP
ncbi:MAG: carbon-nitrogen hydrolase family protein [Oscillibacter sp.]|nr:carbon-nitrogen hydrolase family protein [Oscillibacter sp.]